MNSALTTSKTFNLEVEVLTAIHIGTGEQLEPLQYVVSPGPDDHAATMKVFRLEALMPKLTEKGRSQLIELSESGDLVRLRKGIQSAVLSLERKGIPIWDYEAAVTHEVAETYESSLASTHNQLLIAPTIRTGTRHLPYVPGSSLKGSLRTGILQAVADRVRWRLSDHGRGRDVERQLLKNRDAKSDPFRSLRITDAVVSGNSSALVAEMRLWKQSGDTGSPQITAEFLRGTLLDGDARARIGVTVDNRPFSVRGTDRWQPPTPSNQIDANTLLTAADAFYRDVLESEYAKFYLATDDDAAREAATELKQIAESLDATRGEFLVRLGRFSQKESVTLHDVLTEFGKSRTLVRYRGRLYGAGWAVLRVRSGQASSKKKYVVRTQAHRRTE